ncbi:MAG: hypothetical protein N2517_07025 [Ignavibacteria bacterium]|nr:hypothetical protein [Ignavibacteria bacterium]
MKDKGLFRRSFVKNLGISSITAYLFPKLIGEVNRRIDKEVGGNLTIKIHPNAVQRNKKG